MRMVRRLVDVDGTVDSCHDVLDVDLAWLKATETLFLMHTQIIRSRLNFHRQGRLSYEWPGDW